MSEKAWGIVARMGPIHLGHQAILDKAIEEYGKKLILFLWSANNPQSLRHFFTYQQRRDFIKTLYPDIIVAPLPDFPTNEEWFVAIDDLTDAIFGPDAHKNMEFFGWCIEDVEFFEQNDRKIKIVNRFDGTTPIISATQVRDALIWQRSIEDFVDSRIEKQIRDVFTMNRENFRKK